MSTLALPSTSFLSDAGVYQVDDSGRLIGAIGSPMEKLVLEAIGEGGAKVSTASECLPPASSAAIAIPIYRGGRVISVVALASKSLTDDDTVVGVLEVWEPIGIYEELALRGGFFGKMDRFKNVSSFVRFEKGSGLPGQVWQTRQSVIHDDLINHPGFLRAAGASADLLVTAIGIPVASTSYHGSAVLISSGSSPLARGFEVWQADGDGYLLTGCAYRGFGDAVALSPGKRLPLGVGMPATVDAAGGGVLSDDVACLFHGRADDAVLPTSASGLAIPFYDGDTLSSVAVLLF